MTATTVSWTSLAALPSGPSGGSELIPPNVAGPFRLYCLKGAASATLFLYDAGLNTWSTPTTLAAGETFTTGASTCLLPSRRKLWIQKEVSQRTYVLDLVTGQLDAGPFLPYSASAGYDGHRACYARAPSGFEWLYLLRASGQEFFRVPIEWF